MSTKKQKFARKAARQFPKVRFESKIFEGMFELPALDSFDLKTQRSLMNNNVSPLFDLLAEAKVEQAAIDAIDSLAGEEVGSFMEEWSEASEVPAPKSGA